MGENRKQESVHVRVSRKDVDLMSAAAAADDLPLATYMRRAALREARRALARRSATQNRPAATDSKEREWQKKFAEARQSVASSDASE
jgi:uncharacterized protein (DUF1778 family)